MIVSKRALAFALLCTTASTGAAPLFAQNGESRAWVIRADTLYTAAGDPIENGSVVVADGVIGGVGPGGGGGGGDDLAVAAVTPGLIDLSVRIDTGRWSVEESTEVEPGSSVADGLDVFSYRWDREARSGVTTALALPYDANVIGGTGILLKTAGALNIEERTVLADAVLRGSTGTQPSMRSRFNRAGGRPRDFRTRRPTTRMSVEWLLRKTFYDALAARRDSERSFDGIDKIESVLRGDLPLSLQAWATQDIRTSIYLKEEFGIPKLIIDAAAEAWREPELLVRSGASVVLPPMTFDGRGQDNSFYAWHSAQLLHELGVPFALSGHGSDRPDGRLALQPAFAMRGGLSFEAALEAVTITPARMLGVDDRIGSIEVGKDADLVLWSGTPFQPTSRVVGVLIDGRLVLDPRSSQ